MLQGNKIGYCESEEVQGKKKLTRMVRDVFPEDVAFELSDEEKPNNPEKVYSREKGNKNKGLELEEY